MTTTSLTDHESYSQAYYLLNEIVSDKDLITRSLMSPDALSLLAEAALELVDYGADVPSQALLPEDLDRPAAALEPAMTRLDELLSRLLLDTTGLSLALRITRTRDLVAQARRLTFPAASGTAGN